jgi:hypothetical protein
MRVSDFTIPTNELKASASLSQAALDMYEHGVDCLPVADDNHQVVGLLTADAVALATAGDRRDPGRTRARRVMFTDCCHCYVDEEVEVALHAMTKRRVRRSVVLDRNEHPVGILALGDLPMRDGHAFSLEAIMDCDRLEQSWLKAARAALARKEGRAETTASRPRLDHAVRPAPVRVGGPAGSESAATAGGLLPVSVFVETYHDYHG